MKRLFEILRCCLALCLMPVAAVAATMGAGENPADNLPPHIRQVTWFGERADWSHDGKRILFLSKTFGDAMELDLSTLHIRNLTAHYPHHGYTRALYLANGDILLSGPSAFDPADIHDARVQCSLYVLDRRGGKSAVPLGTKCSEGPAVSRKRMHIAWTQVAAQYPDEMQEGSSRIQEADIVYDDGRARLANQRVILDSRELPFKCTLETQNFRPPEDNELTFSTYGYQGGEVFSIDLKTKKVTNHTGTPDLYEEPEGIFPDGRYTLVESDRQRPGGWRNIDLWKLRLDGSGAMERLTFFNDVEGFKASNGVVSDDARYLAFQLARSSDAAGVGYGIFVGDLTQMPGASP